MSSSEDAADDVLSRFDHGDGGCVTEEDSSDGEDGQSSAGRLFVSGTALSVDQRRLQDNFYSRIMNSKGASWESLPEHYRHLAETFAQLLAMCIPDGDLPSSVDAGVKICTALNLLITDVNEDNYDANDGRRSFLYFDMGEFQNEKKALEVHGIKLTNGETLRKLNEQWMGIYDEFTHIDPGIDVVRTSCYMDLGRWAITFDYQRLESFTNPDKDDPMVKLGVFLSLILAFLDACRDCIQRLFVCKLLSRGRPDPEIANIKRYTIMFCRFVQEIRYLLTSFTLCYPELTNLQFFPDYVLFHLNQFALNHLRSAPNVECLSESIHNIVAFLSENDNYLFFDEIGTELEKEDEVFNFFSGFMHSFKPPANAKHDLKLASEKVSAESVGSRNPFRGLTFTDDGVLRNEDRSSDLRGKDSSRGGGASSPKAKSGSRRQPKKLRVLDEAVKAGIEVLLSVSEDENEDGGGAKEKEGRRSDSSGKEPSGKSSGKSRSLRPIRKNQSKVRISPTLQPKKGTSSGRKKRVVGSTETTPSSDGGEDSARSGALSTFLKDVSHIPETTFERDYRAASAALSSRDSSDSSAVPISRTRPTPRKKVLSSTSGEDEEDDVAGRASSPTSVRELHAVPRAVAAAAAPSDSLDKGDSPGTKKARALAAIEAGKAALIAAGSARATTASGSAKKSQHAPAIGSIAKKKKTQSAKSDPTKGGVRTRVSSRSGSDSESGKVVSARSKPKRDAPRGRGRPRGSSRSGSDSESGKIVRAHPKPKRTELGRATSAGAESKARQHNMNPDTLGLKSMRELGALADSAGFVKAVKNMAGSSRSDERTARNPSRTVGGKLHLPIPEEDDDDCSEEFSAATILAALKTKSGR